MSEFIDKFQVLICICLVNIVTIGCSGSDNVMVYPVKGIVMFEGKPMVGGGSISFVPTTSQNGKNAGGIINPDGTFQMTTYDDGDGAMAGTFRVMIMQTVVDEPTIQGDTDTPGNAAKIAPVKTVPPEQQIPLIYADPANSPSTVTIEAKELNELKIELSKQPGGASAPVYGA